MAARSGLENVVFTDKQVFIIRQFVNKLTDCFWLNDRPSVMEHFPTYRK